MAYCRIVILITHISFLFFKILVFLEFPITKEGGTPKSLKIQGPFPIIAIIESVLFNSSPPGYKLT